MDAIVSILCAIDSFFHDHEPAVVGTSTIVIALFTIALAKSTKRLSKVTKSLADITAAEFSASHRPRIRIRAIRFDSVENGEQETDVPLKITVVNVGDLPARVIGYRVATHVEQDLPSLDFYLDVATVQVAVDVAGGAANFFNAESGLTSILHNAFHRPSIHAICVIGTIIYLDERNICRTTGFFRRYDAKSRRFMREATDRYEQYEYED